MAPDEPNQDTRGEVAATYNLDVTLRLIPGKAPVEDAPTVAELEETVEQAIAERSGFRVRARARRSDR